RSLNTTQNVLMDQTIAANFCPFASSSWQELTNAKQTLEFCRLLWRDIFAFIQPRVVISIGEIVERELSRGNRISTSAHPTSWGNINFKLIRFEMPEQPMLLVALPHLSHFKIFSNHRLGPWVAPLVDAVTKALKPPAPVNLNPRQVPVELIS